MDEEVQTLINSSKNAIPVAVSSKEATYCRNYAIFSAIFCVIVAIFLIFGYKSTLSDENLYKIIEKSPFDQKNYRFLRLSNDLSVFLAQNPRNFSENACFSLSIGAGFADEPAFPAGIAHFLAHVAGFSRNFSAAGRDFSHLSTKLQVDAHFTSFSWCFREQFLQEMLRVFVNGLKNPQFSADSLQNAANSLKMEHLLRKSEEFPQKTLQLLQKLAENQGISRGLWQSCAENCGNFNFSREIDAVSAYFREFYSSNLMIFALSSRFSLDFAEKLAKESLYDLRNNRVRPAAERFLQEFTISQVFLHEIPAGKPISLVFAFSLRKTAENTWNLLVSLVKYRGNGSLSRKLRELGLCFLVNAGVLLQRDNFAVFFVQFEGVDAKKPQILAISQVFFEFVREIATKVQEFLAAARDIAGISAVFEEFPENNADFLEKVAKNLKKLQLSQAVLGGQFVQEILENDVLLGLEQLNSKNYAVFIAKSGLKNCNFSEKLQKVAKNQKFRFTDLNSLREELQSLKESADSAENVAVLQEKTENLTFFEEFLAEPLDKFDKVYEFHYKNRDFPAEVRDFLEKNESFRGFFNETQEFSWRKYVPSRLKLHFFCENRENSRFFLKNLAISVEKSCVSEHKYEVLAVFAEKNAVSASFLFESQFLLPKLAVFLDISANFSSFSTKKRVFLEVFCEMARDFLEDALFPAFFAGNSLEIRSNAHGFEFFFEFFNEHEKNLQFFREFAANFFEDVRFSAEIFGFFKEKALRKLRNLQCDDNLLRSLRLFEKILTNYHVFPQESEIELENLAFDEFLQLLQEITQKFVLKRVFLYGNYLRNESASLCEQIIESFSKGFGRNSSGLSEKSSIFAEKPLENSSFSEKTLENSSFSEKSLENSSFSRKSLENSSFSRKSLENSSLAENLEETLTNSSETRTNSSENRTISTNSSAFPHESLRYSNISLIPLTVLQLQNETTRFFFDDRGDFFLESSIILHYFQYGFRDNPQNYAVSLLLSSILQVKFPQFLEKYAVFSQKSLRFSIDLHEEKNISGQLLRISATRPFSAICADFLLEKYYLYVYEQISGMQEQELQSFIEETRGNIREMDASFKEKAKRLWLETQNFLEMNADLRALLANITENITKNQVFEFFREHFAENAKKLEITIENRAKGKELEESLQGNCGVSPEIIKDLEQIGDNFEKINRKIDRNGTFNELLAEIQRVNATKSLIKEFKSLNELENVQKYVFNF